MTMVIIMLMMMMMRIMIMTMMTMMIIMCVRVGFFIHPKEPQTGMAPGGADEL